MYYHILCSLRKGKQRVRATQNRAKMELEERGMNGFERN